MLNVISRGQYCYADELFVSIFIDSIGALILFLVGEYGFLVSIFMDSN